MTRENWIDVSKGICILSVIIGHLSNDMVFRFLVPFHLATFFILSGYTLKEHKLNKAWLFNKFKRLMWPYFITSLCIILMDIFNFVVIKQGDTILLILKRDLLRIIFASGTISDFANIHFGAIGAIWFFPALLFGLIICQFVILISKTYFARFTISGVIAVIGIVSSEFIWLPFSIQSAMLAVPFIIFDKFIKEKNIIDKINKKEWIGLLLIYLSGCITNKSVILFVKASLYSVLTPIIALASCLIVMKISRFFEGNMFLRYCGRNSLYILCIHLFLLETSVFWINKFYSLLGTEPKLTFIIHMVICLLVTAIINLIKRLITRHSRLAIS